MPGLATSAPFRLEEYRSAAVRGGTDMSAIAALRDALARVTSALEALQDDDHELAWQILDDLAQDLLPLIQERAA